MVFFKTCVVFDVRDIDTLRFNSGKFSRKLRAAHGCSSLCFMVGWFARGANEECLQQASTTPSLGLLYLGPYNHCQLAVRSIIAVKADMTIEVLRNNQDGPLKECARMKGVYLSKLQLPSSLSKLRKLGYVAAEGNSIRFELCFELADDSFTTVQDMDDPHLLFTTNENVSPVARCLYESVIASVSTASTSSLQSKTSSSSDSSCSSASSANFQLESTDQQVFHVHSDVLAHGNSSFFTQLFKASGNINDRPVLPRLSAFQLSSVLQCIYLRTAPLMRTVAHIVSVTQAAQQLGMDDLKQLCEHRMLMQLDACVDEPDLNVVLRCALQAFDRFAVFSAKIRTSALNLLMDRYPELLAEQLDLLKAHNVYNDNGDAASVYSVLGERAMLKMHDCVQKLQI